jgi:hypothetical protein
MFRQGFFIMATQKARIPKVGEYVRSVGTLILIEQPPTPPVVIPPPYYVFEEITARIELRRKGKIIKELYELNDFYGLESSVTTAIKEAQEYAKDNDITPDSEMEVVVVRIAERKRRLIKDDKNFYDGTFRGFDYLRNGDSSYSEAIETDVWISRNLEQPIAQ